jgi:hypothetical protein
MNTLIYKPAAKLIVVSILSPLIVAGTLWFFSKVNNCMPVSEAQELVNNKTLDLKVGLDRLDKRTNEQINALEVRLDGKLDHVENNMLTRLDKMETLIIEVIIREQKDR